MPPRFFVSFFSPNQKRKFVMPTGHTEIVYDLLEKPSETQPTCSNKTSQGAPICCNCSSPICCGQNLTNACTHGRFDFGQSLFQVLTDLSWAISSWQTYLKPWLKHVETCWHPPDLDDSSWCFAFFPNVLRFRLGVSPPVTRPHIRPTKRTL